MFAGSTPVVGTHNLPPSSNGKDTRLSIWKSRVQLPVAVLKQGALVERYGRLAFNQEIAGSIPARAAKTV
jgi:hypothetical protein